MDVLSSAEQNRTVQVQGRRHRGEKPLFPRHTHSANTPSEHVQSQARHPCPLSNLLSNPRETLLHDKHDLSGFVRRGAGGVLHEEKNKTTMRSRDGEGRRPT